MRLDAWLAGAVADLSRSRAKALITGGSVAIGGSGPIFPRDGMFGYDYVGYGPPGRVFLGWAHDPYYPRMGPYRTDGPRVFDIFSIRPVRRALSPGEQEE